TPEFVTDTVDRAVECTTTAPRERQRELDGRVVGEIADRDADQGDAVARDLGHDRRYEAAHGREHRFRMGSRVRGRLRARCPAEVVEPEAEDDRAADA